MAKPVLVFYMSKKLSVKQLESIYASLDRKLKEDYHCIIMHSSADTRVEMLLVELAEEASMEELRQKLLGK